jgi:Divalent cation transporter
MADAVGTQTETALIRALAAGVTVRSVLRRELLTGLVIGIVIGGAFLAFALVGWGDLAVAVAVALAVAMFASCSIATLVATALPAAFQRLGKDPAFGSGPLATVFQDLLSITVYPGDRGGDRGLRRSRGYLEDGQPGPLRSAPRSTANDNSDILIIGPLAAIEAGTPATGRAAAPGRRSGRKHPVVYRVQNRRPQVRTLSGPLKEAWPGQARRGLEFLDDASPFREGGHVLSRRMRPANAASECLRVVACGSELPRRPQQCCQDHRGQPDHQPDDPAGDVLAHEHCTQDDGDADDAASRDQAHRAAFQLRAAPLSAGHHALGRLAPPSLALALASLARG